MECLRQKININISCNHLSTHVFFAKTHAVTVTFLAGTCSTTDNKLGDPEASLTLDIFARTPVVLASSVNSGGVGTTVDGSEIRRSPVEVGSSSHYLQGFIHPRWCRISSIHSRIFCCWVQSGTKHCEVIRGRFFFWGGKYLQMCEKWRIGQDEIAIWKSSECKSKLRSRKWLKLLLMLEKSCTAWGW